MVINDYDYKWLSSYWIIIVIYHNHKIRRQLQERHIHHYILTSTEYIALSLNTEGGKKTRASPSKGKERFIFRFTSLWVPGYILDRVRRKLDLDVPDHKHNDYHIPFLKSIMHKSRDVKAIMKLYRIMNEFIFWLADIIIVSFIFCLLFISFQFEYFTDITFDYDTKENKKFHMVYINTLMRISSLFLSLSVCLSRSVCPPPLSLSQLIYLSICILYMHLSANLFLNSFIHIYLSRFV